jgi:hypothetical protein
MTEIKSLVCNTFPERITVTLKNSFHILRRSWLCLIYSFTATFPPQGLCVRQCLKNSTLLGQPEVQKMIKTQSVANIITDKRKNNKHFGTRYKQNYTFSHSAIHNSTGVKCCLLCKLSARLNFVNVFVSATKSGKLQIVTHEHFLDNIIKPHVK